MISYRSSRLYPPFDPALAKLIDLSCSRCIHLRRRWTGGSSQRIHLSTSLAAQVDECIVGTARKSERKCQAAGLGQEIILASGESLGQGQRLIRSVGLGFLLCLGEQRLHPKLHR